MKLYHFIILILLSGCATSYQPHGFTGGYSHKRLNRDIYEVSFSGNGYTSSSTVRAYAMRRSAELAVEKGYDYFIILDNVNDTDYSVVNTNNQTNLVSKSSASIIVKMFFSGEQPVNSINAKIYLGN